MSNRYGYISKPKIEMKAAIKIERNNELINTFFIPSSSLEPHLFDIYTAKPPVHP